MSESTAASAARNRWSRLLALPTLAALLATAAAISAVVQLPTALKNFDDRATFNSSQSAVGREIAGADAMDIDNVFLEKALELLPSNTTYAIRQPQSIAVAKSYGISPTTYNALPGFVQNVLLPRRQVDPDAARYLLCYACDTDPYDKRMRRLWQDPHGLVIGELTR